MRYLVMNFRPISMRLCLRTREEKDIETIVYLARMRQQKETISMIYWKRNMIDALGMTLNK